MSQWQPRSAKDFNEVNEVFRYVYGILNILDGKIEGLSKRISDVETNGIEWNGIIPGSNGKLKWISDDGGITCKLYQKRSGIWTDTGTSFP